MNKDLRATLAENLKTLRKQNGFKSAESIARHIGIEPPRYREYEAGRVIPSYEIAWKLADAFHCSMDDLGGRKWPLNQDADTENVAFRYAALPPQYRETVKDMIELQEEKYKRVRVSGNQGEQKLA